MSQMSEVIGLLTRTNQDFEYTQRRSRRARITVCAILSPLYIATIMLAIFFLMRLVHGEDPFQFWIPCMSLALMTLHMTRVYISFGSDSRAPLFAPVTALRQAIQAGDTILAPIVLDHPAPAMDPPAAIPIRIGPLPRPFKWSHPLIVLAILLPVIAIIAVPCLFAYINIQAGAIVGIALLSLASICGVLAYRACGPVPVRVDVDGLHWRKLLVGHHLLTWRNAQALIRIGDANLFLDDRKTTFILYGANRVFAWTFTGPSEQARIATQSLLHTITQHTGLPLRNVSAEVRSIAYGLKDLFPVQKHSAPATAVRLRMLGIVLLPVMIVALVAGTFQIAGPWYFEHLYTQSHAATPLYDDPLTHKDSDWPETKQARFTGASYTITHNLELFGFGSSLILPPHHYDHAIYEVTARASGDTNAGLAILSSDSSRPLLAFYAAPDGSWWLQQDALDGKFHDHWFYRLGHSSAIHLGSGAPNRIGMLVQGSDVTFYINGHYITRYHDDHLAGGPIGLYLDPEPGQGSFTDFAIYPA